MPKAFTADIEKSIPCIICQLLRLFLPKSIPFVLDLLSTCISPDASENL